MPSPLANPVAEKDVLSALLADRSAVVAVMDIVKPEDFLDLRNKAIAKAVWDIYSAGELINRASVINRISAEDVDPSYVASLAKIATDKAIREVQWNAKEVHRSAIMYRIDDQLSITKRKLVDRDGVDDLGAFIEDAAIQIANVQDDVLERDASIQAIAKEEAESNAEKEFWKTGLNWLDNLVGGGARGAVWVIAGPYKHRKSSLVRNLVYNLCQHGVSFDWFNLERSRVYHYQQMLALVANKIIREVDVPNTPYVTPVDIAKRNYFPGQEMVIESAKERINNWRLRIWDGRDGIASPEKVSAILRRNLIVNQTGAWCIDHIQRSGTEGTIFERISHSMTTFANLTVETQTLGIIVSQLNESSVRSYGEKSQSFGAKGGGDIPAAADVGLTTFYDPQQDPLHMKVELRLSRDSGVANRLHEIEPTTGLILDGEMK